jgi:cupin fold WbuC family metalloprotein
MREAEQALFNDEDVLVVDDRLIERLKRRARETASRRFRLCLHHSEREPVQEMIVVHCRENYSRPHRHAAASSMLVLEGDATVLTFDDRGEVTRRIELGPRASGKAFTLRIEAHIWHMPVCRTEQLVFYETMEGPFERERINIWAPWSPEEHDGPAIDAYLRVLRVR